VRGHPTRAAQAQLLMAGIKTLLIEPIEQALPGRYCTALNLTERVPQLRTHWASIELTLLFRLAEGDIIHRRIR
jgi:hypothetical protein